MSNESREHLLPYGILPNGNLAHVSDVSSGLACNCRCPECGGLLVARKGQVIVHHFAHQAGMNCTGGGWETALHRLCKEIIMSSRRIMLPAVIAEHGSLRRVVSKASMFTYQSSRDEVRMDGLVPDVVVEAGGRSLLLEVMVTHACGPEKLTLLHEQRLACVEIDMSVVDRNLPRIEHEQLILVTAPRKWLFNARIQEATDELRAISKEQARARRERLDLDNARRLAREWFSTPRGCFTTSAQRWQECANDFLSDMPSSRCEMRHLLSHLASEGHLKLPFALLNDYEWTPALRGLLDASCPGFVSPQSELSEWLHSIGCSIKGKWLTMFGDTSASLAKARLAAQEQARRICQIDSYVESLTNTFPDKKDDIREWATNPLGSVIGRMGANSEEWLAFRNDMDATMSMFLRGGPLVDQSRMMGLPLHAERSLLLGVRNAQKQQAREKKEKEHRERVQSMLARISEFMGEEGVAWACSRLVVQKHDLLQGMLSLSEHDLHEMRGEFENYAYPTIKRMQDQRARELKERKDADLHVFCTQLLLVEARAAFSRKPSQAEAWMSYPNKFLGGRRPSEFCRNHHALKECRKLLRDIAG